MKLFEYDEHIGDFRVLVNRHDIERNAIGRQQIAPEAVTNDKIAPGAVGMEQLAPEAVDDLSRLEGQLAGLISEAEGARDAANEAAGRAEDVADAASRINISTDGRVITITNRNGEQSQVDVKTIANECLDESVASITDAMIESWFSDEEEE